MGQRFYVAPPVDRTEVVLAGSEGRHLARVMRATPGDRVQLFDGIGNEFEAGVRAVGKDQVQLQVLQRRELDRELPANLILAVSLPKGDRQRWLVEKLVELGTSALVPLVTRRGVAQPQARVLGRLERVVIESCKQCGRNRLMKIASPLPVGEAVAQFPVDVGWLADRGGAPAGQAVLAGHPRPPGCQVAVLVGPEGGFTAEERETALAAGYLAVDLGRRILRIETAAITAAAVWSQFLAPGVRDESPLAGEP